MGTNQRQRIRVDQLERFKLYFEDIKQKYKLSNKRLKNNVVGKRGGRKPLAAPRRSAKP